MMIIPLWDPAAAATEIERTAARGAKSIAFSENPTKLGLPSIHTDYWDPVLARPNEAGLVLSMHVGSSSNLIRTSDDMPTLAFMAYSAAANQAGTLLDWLFSGNFESSPGSRSRCPRDPSVGSRTSWSGPSRWSTSNGSGPRASTST